MIGTTLTLILLLLRSTILPQISIELCIIPILMTLASKYGAALYKNELVRSFDTIEEEMKRIKNEKKIKDISKKL